MKELSIAGKATRYDEALKEAVIAHKDEDRHLKATLERIFPELKESENERIMKEIIDIIDSYDVAHLKAVGLPSRIPKYIAWLEKQGGHAKFINGIQVGDKVTRNQDGILVNLSQLNRVAKKEEPIMKTAAESLGISQAEYDKIVDKYLYGKGPELVDEGDIPFGAKDSELEEVTYLIPEGYHAVIDGDKIIIRKR